jgi:hypothetical protein
VHADGGVPTGKVSGSNEKIECLKQTGHFIFWREKRRSRVEKKLGLWLRKG